MVFFLEMLGHWEVTPTFLGQRRVIWDFVVKMMEAAALSDTTNVASVTRECGARLDLANYLASMPKILGLKSFTMTTKAKEKIAKIRDWGPSSFVHLEGNDVTQGKILDEFPADYELFENWDEFCTAYAKASLEHVQMQKKISEESKL